MDYLKKHGLTSDKVAESREKYGSNLITPQKQQSILSMFLQKFKDPIIIILLVALVLSFGISVYEYGHTGSGNVFFEPIGILVAIVLATGIGFMFELSAKRKFDVLNKSNDETFVKVVRDGSVCRIMKKDVVVGDYVILETGDEVPADGTLCEAVSLQINESSLTGEPVCGKTVVEEDFDPEATYPSNMVLRGTSVMEGHGAMVVDKVGDHTEYGKVYRGSQMDNNIKTPLNLQLEKLARFISYASYAIAALIIISQTIIYINSGEHTWVEFGSHMLKTFMIAVTVIVVAVPEGLPMSVTLSLALSMKRMLNANTLVRKMHACETMGACTVICTDKTGTLTKNKMTVYAPDFFCLDGNKLGQDRCSKLIADSISVNSTAFIETDGKSVIGNPTEGALLLWMKDNGMDYDAVRKNHEVVEQLTFSTERKYMATVGREKGQAKTYLYVKGAPEIVMGMCSKVLENDVCELGSDKKASISSAILEYQNKGMRTLGFAFKEVTDDKSQFENSRIADTAELVFLGFVAISDPVRDDIPGAIGECFSAGIKVKIVTGDTTATAKEIARQIGLWKDGDGDRNIITGVDFAAASDEELLERIDDIKIMARARPIDKSRLVNLLQRKGHVVSVTGDGTNDAPALKAAQVGLSMGDGTSVAKEASDITILDNSFRSIVNAVMWGRSLYNNIRRFIVFQMTINVVACIIVLLGSFFGTESPLTVTQMLWVNLIMDTFAALALASLPPDGRVMQYKPRKQTDSIISSKMARQIILTGLCFVVILFMLMQYFRSADITAMTGFSFADMFRSAFRLSPDGELSRYELSVFFTVFVFMQFWNMFNAKAFMSGRSAFHDIRHSGNFLLVAFIILIGQVVIVTFGGEMFTVHALQPMDWVLIFLCTSPILIIGEIYRLIVRDRA